MRDNTMLGCKLGRQLRHGDVAFFLYPADQDRGIGRQFPATRRTALSCGSNRARRGYPLRNPYARAGTDPETPRRITTRGSILNRPVNPDPKVRRIALADVSPPGMVNHIFAFSGIHSIPISCSML